MERTSSCGCSELLAAAAEPPELQLGPKGAATIARTTVEPAESAADGSDGIASSGARRKEWSSKFER